MVLGAAAAAVATLATQPVDTLKTRLMTQVSLTIHAQDSLASRAQGMPRQPPLSLTIHAQVSLTIHAQVSLASRAAGTPRQPPHVSTRASSVARRPSPSFR